MTALKAAVVAFALLTSTAVGATASTGQGLCGARDLPEGASQLQGDVPQADRVEVDGRSRAERGYNCGLALVGHATLDADGRDPLGNANMAWAGSCAYVSGPGTVFGPAEYDAAQDDPHGVAVVDVRDPARPRHVRTLKGAGSTQVSETIYAVDAPGRSTLVVGTYGNSVPPGPASGGDAMDVYDVTGDLCRTPRLLGTFVWPQNIHNLTLSGDGRYVFATQSLQVVDLAPLYAGGKARYLGNLEDATESPLVTTSPGADVDDAVPAARSPRSLGLAHQVWTTFRGDVLYMGATTKQSEIVTVLDIKDWLTDQTRPPRVVSQRSGRGHGVDRARIGRGAWLMHSEESVFGQAYGCYGDEGAPFAGTAEPYLSDYTDPAHPVLHVSRLGLEINKPENCLAQQDSQVQASSHYNEFDDERNAKLAIVSMQNAGIRVFDVRNPRAPVEVAYFNPGDVDPGEEVVLDYAWGHPRYVPETGQIWFASRSGGFWVVELEPQVRRHLGVRAAKGARHARGGAGTTRAALPALHGRTPLDLTGYWCALSPVGSVAG